MSSGVISKMTALYGAGRRKADKSENNDHKGRNSPASEDARTKSPPLGTRLDRVVSGAQRPTSQPVDHFRRRRKSAPALLRRLFVRRDRRRARVRRQTRKARLTLFPQQKDSRHVRLPRRIRTPALPDGEISAEKVQSAAARRARGGPDEQAHLHLRVRKERVCGGF
jgi:hypothetical protein